MLGQYGKEEDYDRRASELSESSYSQLGAQYLVENFAKYTSRRTVTRFLARNEIFRKVLDVHGSIIECGVFAGQGLMTFVQLSSIYEPVGGKTREVFGFDTFAGFPEISNQDDPSYHQRSHQRGDFSLDYDVFAELSSCIDVYDKQRFLSGFPKAHLIRGDFRDTSQEFFVSFPHVIPALLYLDFDLYEPTKLAIETFLPRMPRGAIVAFDELNNPLWPGETLAAFEALDLPRCKLRKVPFDPNVSYMVIGD